MQEWQELVIIEPLCRPDVQAGMALCARCARLVNRRLELMEWVRSLRKMNETWVHPHVITPVITKIRDSFKHPAQSTRCAVQSRRPASHTLPHDKANVPGLSSRWACGGTAASARLLESGAVKKSGFSEVSEDWSLLECSLTVLVPPSLHALRDK